MRVAEDQFNYDGVPNPAIWNHDWSNYPWIVEEGYLDAIYGRREIWSKSKSLHGQITFQCKMRITQPWGAIIFGVEYARAPNFPRVCLFYQRDDVGDGRYKFRLMYEAFGTIYSQVIFYNSTSPFPQTEIVWKIVVQPGQWAKVYQDSILKGTIYIVPPSSVASAFLEYGDNQALHGFYCDWVTFDDSRPAPGEGLGRGFIDRWRSP